jgi:phytoene dehydrogenase-like protein
VSRSVDAVVVGGGANGLTAAIGLARGGYKVLVAEAATELGGVFREIEFAPGFRVAPLAADVGYLSADVLRGTGLGPLAVEPTADVTLTALGDGEPLQLHPDVARASHGLQRFSRKDAERWPAFVRQVDKFTGFLAELYRLPPPRIAADSLAELLTFANLGRKFRSLGKSDMIELMRVLPMSAADWLDDWFESDRLKGLLAALAVSDVSQGPMSGGTAFTFLHRHVGAKSGVFGERLRLKAGPMALIMALAERARSAGVTIETGAAVEHVIVRDDHVTGVRLASGEEIACRAVASSLDPTRSLFELLDPVHLDPEFMQAVRNIRYRGVTTKVLLGLDGGPAPPVGATIAAPSVRYVERAYDAVKYGRCSEEPILELRYSGANAAVLHVQFSPYGSRDSIAERAIALLDQHLPGFSARIRARSVLTPADLEANFGLREGAISQGEMLLDQILFMRPIAGASRYAMPVPGFYLCGTGTHPGGGVTGMSGWLAAQAVLSALR